MHVMATNLCVWIKTLVYESLKEIDRKSTSYFIFSKGIVSNLSTEYQMIGKQCNHRRLLRCWCTVVTFGLFAEQGKNVLKGLSTTTPRGFFKSFNLEVATDAPKTFYEKIEPNIPHVPYALLDQTLNATTRLLTSSTAASTTTQSKILSTLPKIVSSSATTAATTTTQAIVTNSIWNGFAGKSVVGKI